MHQLRIYEIFDHNKASFHDRFRDHAARIMARHGFDIVAMWEARGTSGPEFIYLLHWSDDAAMTAGWADFMADAEWLRIRDASAAEPLVGRIENRTMQLSPYSATRV